MLIKAEEKHRHIIMKYLLEEPNINIFLIGDIENFGFNSSFQDIWFQMKEEQIVGIALRYHSTLILYSKDLNMDFDLIVKLLNNISIDNISGKKQVIDLIYPLIQDDFNRNDMKFCEYKKKDKLVDSKDVEIANIEDAMEIAIAYGDIEEFKYLYSPDVNKRYEQISNRIISKEGKHMFIKDSKGIVSHGNTTAENSVSAMVGGIFTRKDKRREGYASQILSALVKDLMDRGRDICLFYKDEKEGQLFKKLGFEFTHEWTILGRLEHE